MPFRVWIVPGTPLFRIELPCITKTTPTEWKFDTIISSIEMWKPWNPDQPLLYGLSRAAFPPYPKGCQLVNIVQNEKYPFNSTEVVDAAYVESKKTTRDPTYGQLIEQLFLYSYSIPDTVLMYFHVELDMYNNINFELLMDPASDDTALQQTTVGKYIHISLYALKFEYTHWRSTTESLCVPVKSLGKNTYCTLKECQEKTYGKVRNRHTWVGTNSEPLYKYMRWWERQDENAKLLSLKYQTYED